MAQDRHRGFGAPTEPTTRSRAYRDSEQPLRAAWDPESRVAHSAAGGARQRRRSPMRRFVEAWGWRAYAIPVLVLITGAVVVDAVRSPELTGGTVEEARQDQSSPQVLPAMPGVTGPIPVAGELPNGGDFAQRGTGAFHMVGGSSRMVGKPEAEEMTFSVEVEDGIDTTSLGGDSAIGQMIEATLFNPKSWTGDGKVAYQRVDKGEPTFRVSLTTPETVRANCGYSIKLETSCFNPGTERVYLNLARWVRGATSFQGDMGSYRQYLINHEVGHAVGHPEHLPCPKDGALAPVMMQQTISVNNADLYHFDPNGLVPDNQDTCRYNPWPFPEA